MFSAIEGNNMNKVWLKNYPEGIPSEIDVNQYQSIVEIFEESCQKYKNNPAFNNFGAQLTYGELEIKSRHFAAYLQKTLGLIKGNRVAIMMPNLLQYPVVLFAILRAGLIVINVNPLYTASELAFQLSDSGAETIIVVENFADTVAKALPQTKLKNIIITKMGDMLGFPKSMLFNFVIKYIKKIVPRWILSNTIKFNDAMKQGSKLQFDAIKLTHEDLAFLQYTGGTTGIPKGAALTHRNLIANILQIDTWFQPILIPGKEIIITAIPLYHVFALVGNCLVFFRLGGLNYLISNPRDINNFINLLKNVRFTVITGVNTLFNALMNNSHFTEINFSSLKLALAGGMAVLEATAEKWQRLTHTTLLQGYGMTETPTATVINPYNMKSFNGSIGLPLPSVDIAIYDDNGKELGFNEPGELCVKTPQVMPGYWNRPDETAKVFFGDDWLKTGDIATIDVNGFIRIVDRKKDMINISGFKVFPNEVEDVISKIPGVLEVGVVGVNTENGEMVKAFVVKKDPNLTEQDIIKYCLQHITRYKIPKEIVFVKELPKTYVGKILRRALIS